MITFSSSLPFQVFPNYHIYPPTAPHVAYMQPKANAPSFFMADELRQVCFQKLRQTLIIGYALEQENGCAGHCLVSHCPLSKEIQNMEVLCMFKEILNNVLEYKIQNLVFKCASFLCFVFFVQKVLFTWVSLVQKVLFTQVSLLVCVYMHAYLNVLGKAYGSQKICGSLFFPSTVWILCTKLRLMRLDSKCLSSLSHHMERVL